MTTPSVLETRGLVKRFGGVTALDNVDFELRGGEVHGLCGENGAGKSTLIKILTGVYAHDTYTGEVLIDGETVRLESIRDSEAAGIAVIHQELALVDEMSVAENIFLGHEPTRLGLVDHHKMYADATALLGRFDIAVAANRRVGDLGVGQQQLVAIAKALKSDSKVLILDEPTAALTEQEIDVLLDIIRDLHQRGVACIYISHKLDEVFAIADRITVLRDGTTVARLDACDTDRDEVIQHMVGRRIADLFPLRKPDPGDVALAVDALTIAESRNAPPRLKGISFEVRAGEVLGIGGLMGAGRSELLLHLVGFFGHRVDGSVQLLGQPLALTPRGCVDQGLVLVSEDRKRYGLILDQSVTFNLSLSSLPGLTRAGRVDRHSEARICGDYAKSLQIKAPNLASAASTLSGGNQQKVVLGKALMTKPKVILLDEPTRGIDVGAKREIYDLINQLTDSGVAIVMVSSELPELMRMSDRIMMLSEGTVGGHFTHNEATAATLLAAAMSTSHKEQAQP